MTNLLFLLALDQMVAEEECVEEWNEEERGKLLHRSDMEGMVERRQKEE